jgi:hypothetical protein
VKSKERRKLEADFHCSIFSALQKKGKKSGMKTRCEEEEKGGGDGDEVK